jgi:uncharacterized GH25 family protein
MKCTLPQRHNERKVSQRMLCAIEPLWQNSSLNKLFHMKKISLTILLLSLLTVTNAQEFWLQPDNFFCKRGEKLVVSFKEGENFMGDAWDFKKHSIAIFNLHHASTSMNLADSIKDGDKGNLSYTLKEEGTHLLVMKTNNVFNEMGADNFNAYLKEAGLDDIMDHRQKTNTVGLPGKENYAIHVKLFIQVGENKDDTYKTVIGSPVEIVPQRNPYALQIGDPVRFKILFDGKPVFGVRVKVWNRFDNRTTIQNIYTEQDGTFEARISNPGPWMVSVVRMVPSKQAGADWQSYKGSLVFGIQK